MHHPEGGHSVIATTNDPVAGNKVYDLEQRPFVVEGSGMAALKNCFESAHPRRAYPMAQPAVPDLYEDDFSHHS